MTPRRDPLQQRERDLVAETIGRAMSGDEVGARQAHAELENVQMDTLPPDGHYRIRMGQPRLVPAKELRCPRCGRTFTTGAGVSFVDRTEDEFGLSLHRNYRCRRPGLRIRWWRLKWSATRTLRHKSEYPWTAVVRWRQVPKEHRRGGPLYYRRQARDYYRGAAK